jgi:hypothetical protein
MKQQITIRNTRELELKKSMLNFKMFSLMKKQLFSLVMGFALIVMASTGAWAQANGLSPASAYWHLAGSVHQLQVNNHTGTTYLWAVQSVLCDGTTAGAAAVPVITGGNTYQATITYPDAAAGIYRFTVTESSADANACSTVRQFWTAIMNVNVVVIASNAAGNATGLALSTCNDYSLRNGVNGNLVGNTDAQDNTNNLNGWNTNTALYNERFVNVTLSTSDGTGCSGMTSIPAANTFAWRFDYTIAGNNYITPDNFITFGAAPAGATIAAPTDETNTISVAVGTTSITLPLQSFIRWGLTDTDQDQDFTFTVDSNTAVLDDDATLDYTDGKEPVASNGDNTSASQHIDASPATPRIILNY